ncbi:hypothetical protein Tco_0085652 [Tanacetum coccineum]
MTAENKITFSEKKLFSLILDSQKCKSISTFAAAQTIIQITTIQAPRILKIECTIYKQSSYTRTQVVLPGHKGKAEQADWLEDTDEEIDEQELEAHYSYMAKIQEVSPAESSSTDTPLEQEKNCEPYHGNTRFEAQMQDKNMVINETTVKSYQVKDKSCQNNKSVKFQKKEVEDHHRIFSISKKTKSVTACNNSSNSRTSNVNLVCAEYKKPNVVPISASKPKRKANKSVATPHKKTIASDTTIQKFKSYYKKLYENTNQEWKWWIAKRCPSVYTWTQKPLRTKKIWMPKIRKDDESTSISPTIDIVSRITNVLKISNSLGSNLSNVPSSSNSLADCTTHPIHYLATPRQEMVMLKMSLSGIVPLKDQKAQIHDNSEPRFAPKTNVVPTEVKKISRIKGIRISLQSFYLKNITINTRSTLRKTTMIKHRRHRFMK